MLRLKEGFLLRRTGEEYIAVAFGEAGDSFNGMIRLNETGAFFWRELETGSTPERLVEKTLERYEGVDAQAAGRDVEEFLRSIAIALEDVPDD